MTFVPYVQQLPPLTPQEIRDAKAMAERFKLQPGMEAVGNKIMRLCLALEHAYGTVTELRGRFNGDVAGDY